MLNEKERRYMAFHLLRLFFEDLDRWKAEMARLGKKTSLSGAEYEDLFKGTRADIYVPLWASACLSGMDILCNEVTLEVTLACKAAGYQPVYMDGNPADYIGEQFGFLEYLASCALDQDKAAEGEIEEFIEAFTLGTVRVMGTALRSCTRHPDVLGMLEMAEDALLGEYPEVEVADVFLRGSTRAHRNPPVPVEPKQWISQASFNDCGNKCKMVSEVQEGCVLSIRPDTSSEFEFSGCPRGAAYRATFLSSRRLRYPMERIGERGEGRFRRITWEEAEKKIAGILRESHRFGPGSRYVMAGSGVRSLLMGSALLKRLLNLDGGYLGYYNTYSIGAAQNTLPRMFGELRIANHEKEMLNSRLLILWGNNLVTNHFGSQQKKYLMRAKERGARIVVIDPRESDTALAAGDRWIPIRPSTDGALANAMAYVIMKEGLYDREFIHRFCLGFEEETLPEGIPAGESYFAWLDGGKDGVKKTPEWASGITGIPAEDIRELALEYAKEPNACILPGLGIQRTLNGEQNYRAICALPCLTGKLALPGAGLITWTHPAAAKPELSVGKNPYSPLIPVFQWWRAFEAPESLDKARGLRGAECLETRARYLFCIASGMLLNQHSDINHTMRLLREEGRIESVVMSDVLMTPSAKAADLLLPAPSFFETDNICPPWGGENYMLYNHAVIKPLFGAKLEMEWLTAVSEQLGLKREFCGEKRTEQDWLSEIWEEFRGNNPEIPSFRELKKTSLVTLPDDSPSVTFRKNIEKGEPFRTPSGKIDIFWEELYKDRNPEAPAVPAYVPVEEGVSDPAREKYPLQLIGYHSKRRCHSIHDNNSLLEELESPALWIHPDDAGKYGIHDGDLTEIFNDRGRVRIPSFVTMRIARGTVAMSEGAWYTPDKEGVDTRGSINVLTMSHKATPIGNANPQHTNLVAVRRAESN